MVILLVGGLALRSMSGSSLTLPGGSPGGSHPCSPEPCANPNDFELYLQRTPAQPGDGALLRLGARFVNSHNDRVSANGNKNRADLRDFQLQDGRGLQTGPVFNAPGCGRWDSFEIPYPESFGPRPICFRPAGQAPLVVVWGPDLGLLFSEVRIPLPGTWGQPSD